MKSLLIFFTLLYSTILLGTSPPKLPSDTLSKLIDQYEYYFFQDKTPGISESQQSKYKSKLHAIEIRIFQILQQKLDTTIDSTETIKNITALFTQASPIYSYEMRSMNVNIQCSFTGLSYSPPIMICAEKSLNNKISGGIYLESFVERKKAVAADRETGPSYVFTKQNYKYNYICFGFKGSYHLLNIEPLSLNINPKIFDIYSSLLLGYNLAYLKTYLPNTTYSYESPKKQGINIGIMIGVNCFYYDRFNFFCETGYSRNGFISAGVGYRILHPKKEQ